MPLPRVALELAQRPGEISGRSATVVCAIWVSTLLEQHADVRAAILIGAHRVDEGRGAVRVREVGIASPSVPLIQGAWKGAKRA